MIIKWKLKLWLNKRRLVKYRKNILIKKSKNNNKKEKFKNLKLFINKERVKNKNNKVSTCSQASRK